MTHACASTSLASSALTAPVASPRAMGRARLLKSLIASTVITLPIIAPVAAFASPGTQSADGSFNQSVGHPTSTASTLVLAQATGVTYPHEGAAAKPLDNKTAAKQQAAVPLATDFAAHARRAASLDAPLIVLVSLRDCVYCGPIRQRELAPLVRSGKYEVREIGMDSTTPVRDFDGATTTGVAWARAHGVKVSPTVLFLDTSGRPVADPLIGAGLPDFYGAYLDDAIARGRARLQPGSGTTTR
ncbi:hypothetical protein [Pandoraea sputorum]